jgi:uncharacterized protein YkwD
MNIGYQRGVMWMLLAGGVALWLLAVIAVLGLCRAASKADANDAGRRMMRSGRRRATVGLAAAAATLPTYPDEASAQACANRDVPFTQAPAAVRAALDCELDRVRVSRDLRRLRGDGQLELAARRHTVDMVRRRYFSHTSESGADLGDRVRRAGYAAPGCSWRVGEVLAWGVGRRSTAAATVRAWLRSPSHRSIVLSDAYVEAGVAARAGTPFRRRGSGVTVTVVLGRRHC